MKKKLLALAIAGAFAIPAASAVAGSSNVTIYGQMNISYDLVDSGYANGKDQRTSQVTDNASRLGFKGSEDLGSGLAAIWQVESGLNADGAKFNQGKTNGALASRNTFVGLSGRSWGTVFLGHHDTPYKMATRNLDAFGNSVADNRNILGGGNGASAAISFDGRPGNMVAYITPNVNGFTGIVAHVSGAENALTSGEVKGNIWSLAGIYKNGPLFGSFAYEKHNLGTTGSGSVTSALLANKYERAWKLGLGYKWQAFKLGFVYENTKDNFGSVKTPGGSNDYYGHNAYSLNGTYSFGNNALNVAYTRAGDMSYASNTGVKDWTLGVDHHFSKRTTIYAFYTKLTNDTNAVYHLAGGSNGGTAGSLNADPSAFSFGITHKF